MPYDNSDKNIELLDTHERETPNVFEQMYDWFFKLSINCPPKDCVVSKTNACKSYPAYKNKTEWDATDYFSFYKAHEYIQQSERKAGNECTTERTVNIKKALGVGGGFVALGVGYLILKK